MILALILAAISVTPAYTNVNRAGGSKIMTNIEQWAPAVEAAIGQGGGSGVSTNAVSGIITNHVNSGYLATVSELSSFASIQSLTSATQATLNAANADAEAKYLPISAGENHRLLGNLYFDGCGICDCAWIEMMTSQIESFGIDNSVEFTGYPSGISSTLIIDGTPVLTVNLATNLFPIVTNAYTRAYSDARYAPTSTAVTVASHTSQLSQLSQSIDYSTNNTQLVSTITNLAPSKARGISLSDPVRHCNWYQTVTNGVFYWMVEE